MSNGVTERAPRARDEFPWGNQDHIMRRLKLAVAGMRCEVCARELQHALAAQPGVREATVDSDAGEARIFYDPAEVTAAKLVAETRRLAYRITLRAIAIGHGLP